MRILAVFYILMGFHAFGQWGVSYTKFPTYFGVQVRSILPTSLIGESEWLLEKDNYSSTIFQKPGYSFGGILRTGLTEFIALETGINFTQRYYGVRFELPDSSISGERSFAFIQYDIPINALIYVKFNNEWYMNASLGLAATYKPSSVGVITNPFGKHEFFHLGLVDMKKKIGVDINANVGFEWRTKRKGFFYLGGSVRLPLAPMFIMVSRYKYVNYDITTFGNIGGNYLSIDLRYFFPNLGGLGRYAPHGPIE
jgi:hypothetical protein